MTEQYGYIQVHEDLEADKIIGQYGGSHSAYHALAEIRAKEDLAKYHKRRTKDEGLLPNLEKLLEHPRTQRHWNKLVTLDPLGLTSSRPSISATTAVMKIPEVQVEPDGTVVLEDGGINCTKIAIEAVWNIPALCQRLNMDEDEFRNAIHKYTRNDQVKDKTLRAYLPPIGGTTVYIFGDLLKISEVSTEIALRVHDECNGSDVFGTDICTCRPYLVYSIQAAVECAQRGGVGIVIYYRKEGRALGEVTKFRVYNARKRQEGGDRAATYFAQTESIAGIRDARFQELMPDVILWLGIDRIDKLLSMSSDKYEAIIDAGIDVMQRVALPEEYVPENALVEITAKIHAGYHSNDMDLDQQALNNIMSLESIRHIAGKVLGLAKNGETKYFNVNLNLLPKVAEFTANTIKKHYPELNVPYHSRWRHFEAIDPNLISELRASWKCDEKEKVRRLIDLVTISVLLDAGAGPHWKYTDEEGNTYARSEALGLASLDMFRAGLFSSDTALPTRVNSAGIKKLSLEDFKHGLQHSKTNFLVSLDARYVLLQRLAEALEQYPEFFGYEVARPGNILDYVLDRVKDNHISLKELWPPLVESLAGIFPTNTPNIKKGDVWTYQPLKVKGQPGSDLVPFHKISQWLTYSLIEPLESLGLVVDDLNLLTALAEYRNGGLLLDFGVLEAKNPQAYELSEFDVGSELIVEWRALTVALIDMIAGDVRKNLGKTEEEFPMAKVLQGGTWQAGREIAKQLRPEDGRPPIQVRLNGVTF